MNFLSTAFYTAFLICVWLIIYVVYKNPKAAMNRICAVMIGCYAVWNFAFSFMQSSGLRDQAMFWENIASIGWCSFACFSLLCALALTRYNNLLKKWYLYPLLFFAPVFFIYKQWTGGLICGLTRNSGWWISAWSESVWPYLFYAYYMSYMTVSLLSGIVFIRKIKLAPKKRTGAAVIITIISVILISGTVTDVLLPRLKIAAVPPIGSLLVTVWAIGMIFAISRYRLKVLTAAFAAGDILSTMGDFLILTDPAGILINANQAVFNLLGYSKEDLIGKPAEKIFSNADSVFEGSYFKGSYKDDLYTNHKLSLHTKDGTDIPVSFSVSVMRDRNDNIVGVVGVARDMRETLRLQEKERELIAEKSRSEVLREKAKELQDAYDKLKAAQYMLIQSEKMAVVGQLAGGIAHEINNPMGAILEASHILAGTIKEDDPFYKPVKSIEREAARCRKLVTDLLVFSGTEKTWDEAADINDIIDETLVIIEAGAKRKDIVIERDYQNNLPQVKVNINQIQQVLVNLCNNAIDAVNDGGKITIITKSGQKRVEFMIKDNGCGMTEETLKHIYEPFFTTKDVGKGTGLGLSVCYEIVKKHNGIIEAASEPDKGTVFTVKLPLKDAG